jgi:hypothetical protein
MKSNQLNHQPITSATEELIANLAQQALQYVDSHYGSHHAIANSVHSQVDVFCKHQDDVKTETTELSDEELFWGCYSSQASG